MRDVVEENDGVFVLPLEGFIRSGFEDGYVKGEEWAHVDLILHDDPFTESAKVRIGGGEHRALILTLVSRRARVLRMVTSSEATLFVEFDGGESREVPPGKYEAWEVDGTGFKVLAPAGGGAPAIWDASSAPGVLIELTKGEGE